MYACSGMSPSASGSRQLVAWPSVSTAISFAGRRRGTREQRRARRRRAKIAGAAERLGVRGGIEHRVATAAVHHAVRGDEPEPIGSPTRAE